MHSLPPEPPGEWTDVLATLRQEYVADCLARLNDLDGELERLTREPGRLDRVRAFERTFHVLVGTGGSYGFPAVTTLARRGEHSCHRLLERGIPVQAEHVAEWRRLTSSLRREFASACLATGCCCEP